VGRKLSIQQKTIGGGGFGVRFVVPFGQLVRLDFGFGQSGKGLLPHLGIREKAYYHRLRVR
jgi:outer membrane translocation and assembly module TamA